MLRQRWKDMGEPTEIPTEIKQEGKRDTWTTVPSGASNLRRKGRQAERCVLMLGTVSEKVEEPFDSMFSEFHPLAID